VRGVTSAAGLEKGKGEIVSKSVNTKGGKQKGYLHFLIRKGMEFYVKTNPAGGKG